MPMGGSSGIIKLNVDAGGKEAALQALLLPEVPRNWKHRALPTHPLL